MFSGRDSARGSDGRRTYVNPQDGYQLFGEGRADKLLRRVTGNEGFGIAQYFGSADGFSTNRDQVAAGGYRQLDDYVESAGALSEMLARGNQRGDKIFSAAADERISFLQGESKCCVRYARKG